MTRTSGWLTGAERSKTILLGEAISIIRLLTVKGNFQAFMRVSVEHASSYRRARSYYSLHHEGM